MIGIFDGGLGGLAVLREVQRQLPEGDVLFFGDTAAGPFDDKSPGRVAARLTEGLARLADSGAALLLVADHGAAACLTPEIRSQISIPVFDIITHGVVPAITALAPGSLGVVGPSIVETVGTHQRAVGEALPGARIYCAAAPLISPLVDAGWLKKPETVMIVKKCLHFFKLRQIEALVLGSNHYLPLFSVIQRKIGKRVALVNGAPVLAREVKTYLDTEPDISGRCIRDGSCRAVVSDMTGSVKKNARLFYGKNIQVEQI